MKYIYTREPSSLVYIHNQHKPLNDLSNSKQHINPFKREVKVHVLFN